MSLSSSGRRFGNYLKVMPSETKEISMQYLNYLFLLQLVCHEGSNGIQRWFPVLSFLSFLSSGRRSPRVKMKLMYIKKVIPVSFIIGRQSREK